MRQNEPVKCYGFTIGYCRSFTHMLRNAKGHAISMRLWFLKGCGGWKDHEAQLQHKGLKLKLLVNINDKSFKGENLHGLSHSLIMYGKLAQFCYITYGFTKSL